MYGLCSRYDIFELWRPRVMYNLSVGRMMFVYSILLHVVAYIVEYGWLAPLYLSATAAHGSRVCIIW